MEDVSKPGSSVQASGGPSPGAAIVQALDNYTEARANMDFAQFHPDRREELSADLQTARNALIGALDAATFPDGSPFLG